MTRECPTYKPLKFLGSKTKTLLLLVPLLILSCGRNVRSFEEAKADAIGVWEGDVLNRGSIVVNRIIFEDDGTYSWAIIKEVAFVFYGWDPKYVVSESGTWSVDEDKDSKYNGKYYLTITPYEKNYDLGNLIYNELEFDREKGREKLRVYNYGGVQIGLLLSKKE